jgi:predicted GNAT family N-acyltransferase
MVGSECIVVMVDDDWPRFDEVRGLVYDVLYRDFDVDPGSDWHPPTAEQGPVAVALCAEAVVGTARLVGAEGAATQQLRQLAVVPARRGGGVGRSVVEALEARAAASGSGEIWLYARENAYRFYERLGYTFDGDTFVSELTGIPHRRMRKQLGDGVV